jgi:hypothetical protein
VNDRRCKTKKGTTTGQAFSGRPKEAIMSQPISPQHPAVVLRSHYVQVRALLAIAMIAVVGLTVAVAILATNNDRSASVSAAAPVAAAAPKPLDVRYDGGPEEGTRGPYGHALGTNVPAPAFAQPRVS